MTKIIISFLTIVSLSFCSQQNTIEHYPDGNIKCIYEVDEHGKKNGQSVEFYNSGDTMGVCYYKDDKLHGDFVRYHSNGFKSVVGKYRHGNESGWFEVYSEDNILSKRIQFGIQADSTSIANQQINYTSSGSIDSLTSMYFELNIDNTFSKKDSTYIRVKLNTPKDNLIRAGTLYVYNKAGVESRIRMNDSLEAGFYAPQEELKFKGCIIEGVIINDEVKDRCYYFSEKHLTPPVGAIFE